MNIKNIAVGGIITLVIGGSAFTVSKTDIANNFANDTGLTKEQAEQYVNNVDEKDLSSFGQIGTDLIDEGMGLVGTSNEIDCANYDYEWQTSTLSCSQGKYQIRKLANDTTALGLAYRKLDEDSATTDDMRNAIKLIDQLNMDYQMPIVNEVLDTNDIDEITKTNSYNKAVLKAALESKNSK